jgi:hypothetical protein
MGERGGMQQCWAHPQQCSISSGPAHYGKWRCHKCKTAMPGLQCCCCSASPTVPVLLRQYCSSSNNHQVLSSPHLAFKVAPLRELYAEVGASTVMH